MHPDIASDTGNAILVCVIAQGVGIITALIFVGRWAGRLESAIKAVREVLDGKIGAIASRVVTLEMRDERDRDRLMDHVAEATKRKTRPGLDS
jgi:hypothetical protein